MSQYDFYGERDNRRKICHKREYFMLTDSFSETDAFPYDGYIEYVKNIISSTNYFSLSSESNEPYYKILAYSAFQKDWCKLKEDQKKTLITEFIDSQEIDKSIKITLVDLLMESIKLKKLKSTQVSYLPEERRITEIHNLEKYIDKLEKN